MKRCSKCKELKSLTEFHKSRTERLGLRSICKNCHKEYNRLYNKNNRDKRREHERCRTAKRRHGLSLYDIEFIILTQNNTCTICGNTFGIGFEKPTIDHCHTTGEMRGIICNRCNILIGFAMDNPATLSCASEYLLAKAIGC